jgi:ComF family protein
MPNASALASVILDLLGVLLAPPRCAACDAPTPRLAAFCASCATTADAADAAHADHSTKDFAALVYGGAVARAVMRMKYEARPDLARPLGDLLWRALMPAAVALRRFTVVPVPLHPSRLAERGYNQSALLAARVAPRLAGFFAPRALARHRDTPRQATLDREARLQNVNRAFRVRDPAAVAGRPVLLVDDVRTTGATLAACSHALRTAGAIEVVTAVVARTAL